MGLAAPKHRSRISSDPQNTTWANNTTRFGHRILTTQGWKPGSSLGSKNASHASHYTAGSHSHIRVLLKDDTLGIGAKRGSERAENFGLAGLESVLGRLNGKEEEVKKEEERRAEIERRGWVASRYGFMNFVSGGFLIGDKIEKGFKPSVETKVGVKTEAKEEDDSQTEKKAKKRKRDRGEEETEGDEQPKLKRKKKSVDLRATAAAQDEVSSGAEKKSKKDKKEKKAKKSSAADTPADASSTSRSQSPEPLSDKAKRKAEKRARKEEKKLKKALKKAAKDKEAGRSTSAPAEPSPASDDSDTTPAITSSVTTGTSTPVTSSGLTFGAVGRHAARQRYIRQKKMASMDPQALKEILMIKSPA